MKTLKIAFYGKGGIGKSTIATNVSALLAKKGLKVLHIGCDPKADSTRLLTEKKIPSVLQQFDALDNIKRSDLVFEGRYGVQCVEAGGPEAGCGCAGLGIMTAMDELKRLGVFAEPWDVIIYDVLGDVVCGGFSVPMRQHYVDKVYVVTSSYYMALYAANNILKGIQRYSTKDRYLCGGIIANHLKNDIDKQIIGEFCNRVSVPSVALLEDDSYMLRADYQRNLFSLTETCYNSKILQNFVEDLLLDNPAFKPIPLSNTELENFGEKIGKAFYE